MVKPLNSSPSARWVSLFIVSFTMMMGYFITNVMSPLEVILTETTAQGGLGWSSEDYGFFSGSYSFINVFLLMLFFGGLILDKFGIRITGVVNCALMVLGALIKYYAVTTDFGGSVFELSLGFWYIQLPMSVAVASLGFAIFGMGYEITGITVSKVMSKWFVGYELALAMGIQVAFARLGTAAALAGSLPFAKMYGSIGAPIMLGTVLLGCGLIAFLVYCVLDKKLDKSLENNAVEGDKNDENFHFKDLKYIIINKGFWFITLLCLMFYSAVYPFFKFATKLMIIGYNVPEDLAGLIPAIIPFGTIILTPLFGIIFDKKGQGATMMIVGSVMMTIVFALFALHVLPYGWFAIIAMVILGISLSLIPSALWPSIPKIVPLKFLGSGFAIILFVQNIGLGIVPILVGKLNGEDASYYSSMTLFAIFGFVAVISGVFLYLVDKRNGYGLQEPNIK